MLKLLIVPFILLILISSFTAFSADQFLEMAQDRQAYAEKEVNITGIVSELKDTGTNYNFRKVSFYLKSGKYKISVDYYLYDWKTKYNFSFSCTEHDSVNISGIFKPSKQSDWLGRVEIKKPHPLSCQKEIPAAIVEVKEPAKSAKVMNVAKDDAIFPSSLLKGAFQNGEVVRIKGVVSDLKDNPKSTFRKKLEFKLKQPGSPSFVSVYYYYDYKGTILADINLKDGDSIELAGEIRLSSMIETSNFRGILRTNYNYTDKTSGAVSFTKIERLIETLPATSISVETSPATTIPEVTAPVLPKVKVDCKKILSKANGSSPDLYNAYLKKAKRSEGKL